MIALGFARYGQTRLAARIFQALAEAANYLPLKRLPELFCGFAQRRRSGPTGYPVACAPQAWAAATPIALIAACLGMSVSSKRTSVSLHDPNLPGFLNLLTIRGLSAGETRFDIRVDRSGADVRQTEPAPRRMRAG